MDSQQLLLAAISGVTTALCVVAKLLWAKSEKCETDRYELREEIEKLKSSEGRAQGELTAFSKCPSTGCPFRMHFEPTDPRRLP